MGSMNDTEKLDSHSVGGQLVTLTAGWDGKGCVRGKGGRLQEHRGVVFFFPVCLKLEVICSEAAPGGRLEVSVRYLDHCREAVGVIWSRKLGLMLKRSG